jgi:hypothetical protein
VITYAVDVNTARSFEVVACVSPVDKVCDETVGTTARCLPYRSVVSTGPVFQSAFEAIHSKWRRRISVALMRETARCVPIDVFQLVPGGSSEHLLDPRM